MGGAEWRAPEGQFRPDCSFARHDILAAATAFAGQCISTPGDSGAIRPAEIHAQCQLSPEQRASRSFWRAKRSSLTYGSSAVHQLQPAGAVSRDSLLRARRRRAKKFGRSDRPFRILRARSDIARLGPSRKIYPCKGRTFFRGRSCVSSRTSQQPTCSRSAAARYQALRPLSVSIRPSVSSRTYRACPSGGNFLSADHRLQLRSHLWQLSIAHAKGLFPPRGFLPYGLPVLPDMSLKGRKVA